MPTKKRKGRRLVAVGLLLAATLPLSWAHAADDKEKGWFGLAFDVETEGFSFNPTIQSVKITKVAPASPGAGAGLAAGDQVVVLQGITIAGAKADDLKAAMKKSVGETLRFKVRRGNAEPFEVPLVAIAKPAGG